MKILGIDPGSIKTGWALIEYDQDGGTQTVSNSGVFKPKGELFQSDNDLAGRYGHLSMFYLDLAEALKPDAVVVEETVVNPTNARSALKLANARGSIIGAIARCSIPVIEISPTEIKRAMTGKGNADKETVQMMVRLMFGLDEVKEDEADAIAAAYAYIVRLGEKVRFDV